MIIRAKVPLRISFAGGGTDVPPFPQLEGGCVLNATINRYAYGTLRPRHSNEICIDSIDFGVSLKCGVEENFTYDGKLDLVKAAILNLGGNHSEGFDLFLHSDAPPGSGLGSSSAMMVALVGLLKDFKSLTLSDYEIADLAYHIERKELGIEGGLQDQYAATFGGFNYIEFLSDKVVVNPLKISREVINELQYNLVLCYTGQSRLSAGIIQDQVKRYEQREEETLQALRGLKRLTVEMKNALLRRNLDDFGALLHEEWQHKKKMSSKISNPELDALYDTARRHGALGGKISGAGGGGYMLFYCQFDRRQKLREKLTELGCTVTDTAFELAGLQVWRVIDGEERRISNAYPAAY
jgi:D-glycero-alpha-D-manno-heptose-7-phosphate kinase